MNSFDSLKYLLGVDIEFKFVHGVQRRMEKSKSIIIFSIDKENVVRKMLSKLSLAPIIRVIRLSKNKKSHPLQVNFTKKEVLPMVKTKLKLRMIDTAKHILVGADLTI